MSLCVRFHPACVIFEPNPIKSRQQKNALLHRRSTKFWNQISAELIKSFDRMQLLLSIQWSEAAIQHQQPASSRLCRESISNCSISEWWKRREAKTNWCRFLIAFLFLGFMTDIMPLMQYLSPGLRAHIAADAVKSGQPLDRRAIGVPPVCHLVPFKSTIASGDTRPEIELYSRFGRGLSRSYGR